MQPKQRAYEAKLKIEQLYAKNINQYFTMKNIKIIGFSLLLSIKLIAQTEENSKYEIVSLIVNDYFSKIECDYFYSEKPVKPTKMYPDTVSTITIIDVETYETVNISRKDYDSIYLPKKILEYEKEIELWEIKEKLNKKVILLSGFYKPFHERFKRSDLSDIAEFKGLIKNLNNRDSVTWEISKIKNESDYLLSNSNEINGNISKYSVVGYVTISDVITNKERTKAVVYFGIHYMIGKKRSDSGITGFGTLLCLFKAEKGWKIYKSYGLWEE